MKIPMKCEKINEFSEILGKSDFWLENSVFVKMWKYL